MTAAWFKFFSADYLLDAKVAQLPLEAQAILVRIWCLLNRDGAISDDPKALAMRIGADSRVVVKHWPSLRLFFKSGPGGLFSERMLKEAVQYQDKCEKLRERARAGGKAKAVADAKAKQLAGAKASGLADAMLNTAEAEAEEDTTLPFASEGAETPSQLREIRAIWPKARANRPIKILESYLDAVPALLSGDQLLACAEAYLAEPNRSSDQYAERLDRWIRGRGWEPYLEIPEPERAYTVEADPLRSA